MLPKHHTPHERENGKAAGAAPRARVVLSRPTRVCRASYALVVAHSADMAAAPYYSDPKRHRTTGRGTREVAPVVSRYGRQARGGMPRATSSARAGATMREGKAPSVHAPVESPAREHPRSGSGPGPAARAAALPLPASPASPPPLWFGLWCRGPPISSLVWGVVFIENQVFFFFFFFF